MIKDSLNDVYLYVSLTENGLIPIVFDSNKNVHAMSFHCNQNSSSETILNAVQLINPIRITDTYIYTFNCDILASGHLAVQLYEIIYIYKNNNVPFLQLDVDNTFYNSIFELMKSLDFSSFKIKPNTLYIFDHILMSTKFTGCSNESINYVNNLIDNKPYDYVQKQNYFTAKFHHKSNFTDDRSFIAGTPFWESLNSTHDNIGNYNELHKAKCIRGCKNLLVSWGSCAVINVILHANQQNIYVNLLINEGYMTEYYQMTSSFMDNFIMIHDNDIYCDCIFYGNVTRMFKNVNAKASNVDIRLLI